MGSYLISPGMGLPCEEGKRVVTPLSGFHHMSHREATKQTVQSSCPGSPPDTGDGWEPVLRQGEVDFGGSGKKRGKVGLACTWGTSTMPGNPQVLPPPQSPISGPVHPGFVPYDLRAETPTRWSKVESCFLPL